MTPEGKVKEKVKAFLKERGAWFFMPVPTGYGTTTVDFIGCYKGQFFAIETKAPGKTPTARQDLFLKAVQAHGGKVFWSDDAAEIQAWLIGWML